MTFQATVPLVIVGGALFVFGLNSTVYNKREVVERSSGWDRYLIDKLEVQPPRTRIDPFMARSDVVKRMEEWSEICQSPYTGPHISAVRPGSASDAYVGATSLVPLNYVPPEAAERERVYAESLRSDKDVETPQFVQWIWSIFLLPPRTDPMNYPARFGMRPGWSCRSEECRELKLKALKAALPK